MGLLSQGSPLNWEETKKYADHVRKHGIVQFLNIYNKVKERQKDVLLWGDEVEYMLIEMDEKNEKVRLVLNGGEVLETLQDKGEKTNPNHPTLWRPEYGSYMIEGTPGQPYGGTMSEFNTVEDNMGKRRREASSVLNKNETLATITSFPRLGCPGFTQPEYNPTPVEKGVSKSLFFPDEAINRHPRFSTLTRNIRHRRGEKVVINVTFQACSIEEARYLYDQLATFCPIVLFVYLTIDEEINKELLDAGIDKLLAQHIAHLFIRDPLSLFEEKIHLDDENESDHFENLQSTNWQTMRFKPPPPNSDIGWRVEFRPMEVQLTDFENSAYVVFIVLLTRVILSYKLDFLIPLSKVDENMKAAQERNAVQEGMFYFRKDIYKGCNPVLDSSSAAQNGLDSEGDHYILMSIDTIINGKEGVFQGLIPILNCYLENMEVDVDTRCTILNYLKLIKRRASGELMTMAKWMREFVDKHTQYKQDSVITDKINYDLLRKCDSIAKGEERCPELIGDPVNRGK
uniref:Glutamate--cysteine ligase n=1 Tax=Salmo trutta TaxID=8032 RepID=A0A674EZB7_SALTR